MANAVTKANMAGVNFADDGVYWPLLGGSTPQTFYPGQMIGELMSGTHAGYATSFDGNNTLRFLGFMADSAPIVIGSTNSDGDFQVKLRQPRRILLPMTSTPVVGDEGKPVFAADNQTGSYSPGSLNVGTIPNYVGRVAEVPNNNQGVAVGNAVWVEPQWSDQILNVDFVINGHTTTTGITIFTADRPYRVLRADARIDVVATGSTVATLFNAPSGSAYNGTGSTQIDNNAGTINLNTIATNTNTDWVLNTTVANLILATGNSVVLKLSATGAGCVGNIWLQLAPL